MSFLNIFSKNKEKRKKEEKLKIIIDHREKSSLVPSELSLLGFQTEFSQLPIADYIINEIAIERKTISDLKASIINKRIISQLLELKKFPKSLLLIEGSLSDLQDSGLHENALRGFLLSIVLDFSVPIIYTKDAKDTALYLFILAKKSKKEFSLRPSRTFKTKKEQILFILEGFPNIGPVKAKSLISKFKTLKAIFSAPFQDLEKILGKKTQDFIDLIN